jgi:hypothetical protein
MFLTTKTKFVRRPNDDGSYDSICVTCQATAAKARREDELDPTELTHVCDPLRFYEIGRERLAFWVKRQKRWFA